MELVVRLHRYRRERDLPCRIELISDSICWTEVPESHRVLKRQRVRWQRGCIESVLFHRQLICNWKYGSVGLLGIPYFVICEIIGPFIEVSGYAITVLGWWFGYLSTAGVLLFFCVSVLFGLVMSVGSLLLEEMTIRKYSDPRDLLRLACSAVLENLGYRQITLFWRVQAIFQALRRKRACWGEMERRGFQPAALGRS
jgi:cellulose synthase/poly-beta-1,6-N-acetylglucosamine synthase-like glycosyltransferase